jgi:hypothetical protein
MAGRIILTDIGLDLDNTAGQKLFIPVNENFAQ